MVPPDGWAHADPGHNYLGNLTTLGYMTAAPPSEPSDRTPTRRPDDVRFAADLALAATRFTRNAQYFAGTPVSSADWRTIRIIATDGPMRIGELARLERYTAASATVLVNRLVDEGLLAREPDPDDARSKLLTATPEGLARCAEWEEQLGGTVAPLLDALPAADQATLRAALPILRQLTRHLNTLRKGHDTK